MLRNAMVISVVFLAIAGPSAAQQQQAELPVTADVGISSVVGKMGLSDGTGPSTPIMQNQNWSGFENKNLLMAFDTTAIKGWTVSKAYMHVYLAKGDLYGIGLCTVLADWREGRALNYVEAEGAPCWYYRSTPARDAKPTAENWWAWPGSRFFSVSWSHPAARYSNAGPGQIEREKTQDGRFLHLKFPVDPKLVESLAAGVAGGLVLTDDKGQVRESYSLIGPAYPYRYNAAEDIWMFTRDIQEPSLRPKLEVHGAATDKTAPAAPKGLKVAEVRPSDGSVVLEFTAPGDDGMTGSVLAYEVRCEGPGQAGKLGDLPLLPRWSLPKPVAGGKTQRVPIFTLAPGKYALHVLGVDEAGNRGAPAAVKVTIPTKPEAKLARPAEPGFSAQSRRRPTGAKLTVDAVSDMVHVDPVSGGVLSDGRAYQARQPVDVGQVNLLAAANEVAAFQLLLRKGADKLSDVRVTFSDLAGAGGRKIDAAKSIRAFRLWYVSAGGGGRGRGRGAPPRWCGAVCLPLSSPFDESFNLPAADNKVPDQQLQSVWVDVYVPRGTAAGTYAGKITIAAKELAGPVTVDLKLEVLPISLPDKFSWVLELNRYHSMAGWAGVDVRSDPAQALETTLDFYRLAHQHRCVVNALPYSHSGRVDGWFIPVMEGTGTNVRVKDWTDYDKRFGPLLDGTAFSEAKGYFGPGAGVPINHMYTAFHEAWPIWLDKSTYKDWMAVSDRLQFAEYAKQSRRPEVAFTQEYKQGFMAVAKQFYGHFQEKGWTRTSLHFFNNNKYYWKVAYFGGMGRGGVSFWLMDEPTDFDDYDTNAFVMGLGKRARQETPEAPDVRMDGRADVSQPDMARGLWDDIGTVWCIGGLRGYSTTAVARRRWLPNEKHWCYGGGIGVGAAPVGQARSALQRWSFGASGWMPWWDTFRGTGGAWQRADDLAIYYSGHNYAGSGKNYPGPIASVRMKIARRVQQDVEYLHLLAARKGWDRDRVRDALAAYCDDPAEPLWQFRNLSSAKLEELRRRVAATILAEKPK